MSTGYGKVLKSFDQGQKPSLLLDFARRKSLIDQVSKSNLITFTRATAATYVGADGLIKTAASGEARFDHNPVTGESLGLLIEEQRANLLTYSEQFDNAAWAKIGTGGSPAVLVGADQTVAPNGTLTADKLIAGTGGGTHYIRQFFSFAASTAYTISMYVKAGEKTIIRPALFDGSVCTFDASSGQFTSVPVGLTASSDSFGNGWWRISISGTTTVTPPTRVEIYTGDNSAGDGTSGIYIWGVQLEVGSFPTSYIPTTTAAATRNADGAIITTPNVDSWFVQNDGTWFADAVLNDDNTDTKLGVMSVNDSGGSGYVGYGLITSNSNIALYRRNQPLGEAVAINTAASIHGEHKFCFCAGSDIGSISADGGAVLSQTSIITGIDTGLTYVYIGRQNISGIIADQYINGTIKRLIYWPTRLDNSDLQEATR